MDTKFTYSEVLNAYRKAKADAFYETGHNNSLNFAYYEQELFENLKKLLDNLNSNQFAWLEDKQFTGTYALMIKSIEAKEVGLKNVYFSNYERQNSENKRYDINFRVIGQHSVNFHILSSLWIETVGYKLDKFIPKNSYGCRLNLMNGNEEGIDKLKINKNSKINVGHFRNYVTDYKKWQDDGVKVMESALKENKKIIAITTDLVNFYPEIDIDFLISEKFLKMFPEISLSAKELKLTNMLVVAIKFWSDLVIEDSGKLPFLKGKNHCGLPIGIGASKVIANLLLIGIDNDINRYLEPLYYGRYVDDFFIVINDHNFIKSRDDLWNYFVSRIKNLTISTNESNIDFNVIYKTEFNYNKLVFGFKKEKLFFLEGRAGLTFISTVIDAINERSSEWKMLPETSRDLSQMSDDISSATADSNEEITSLRDSDGLSIKRYKFSLSLKKFETLVVLAPKSVWDEGLMKFFTLVEDFIFTPLNLPVYGKIYPRLIQLSILSNNPRITLNLYINIANLKKTLLNSESSHLLNSAFDFLLSLQKEALFKAFKFFDSKLEFNKDWEALISRLDIGKGQLYRNSGKLFYSDFHFYSYKSIFLDNDLSDYNFNKDSSLFITEKHIKLFDFSKFNIKIFSDLFNRLNGSDLEIDKKHLKVPISFVLYTRPFTLLELTSLMPEWLLPEQMNQFDLFLNLYNIKLPSVNVTPLNTPECPKNVEYNYLHVNIDNGEQDLNKCFALTSFLTENSSWVAWVRDDKHEPDHTRYERLFHLVNQILRNDIFLKKPINYVIFPELAIPRNVILYLATKLKTKNISLIAGIEYEKREKPLFDKTTLKGYVSNQLLYVLNTKIGNSYEQLYITQEKIIPARHEESELYAVGGKVLQPNNEFKYLINHSGFLFSGLICNDILNIENRSWLRGLIDALVIIEWNKDVETYEPLVMSTANDLHCFILQVNNREYGDTRLRAPYKQPYMRDLVKVKGGDLDYFVVSTINVEELREFQRDHVSKSEPFKPVPTGFEMSKERRQKR